MSLKTLVFAIYMYFYERLPWVGQYPKAFIHTLQNPHIAVKQKLSSVFSHFMCQQKPRAETMKGDSTTVILHYSS